MPEQIITQEGYNKLKEEHDFLSLVKRKEIAERIERAKELGDLSENAEYSEAKDAQALNEGRIIELSATLKNVTIVNSVSDGDHIVMGSTVTAKVDGKEKEYTIVSFDEAEPLDGFISNESPFGVTSIAKR